jgi:uncharacterized protein (UPF0548 family)
MWQLTRPTDDRLRAVLAAQAGLPFSHAFVGASDGPAPPGFTCDHNRVLLGHGRQTFLTACDVLRRWRQFPCSWTRVWPAEAPIEPGRAVLLIARAFGAWWLNACRIVYVLDETDPLRRFGFAYGTLPGHVACGEERFSVEWLPDDSVWYDLRAFSRPGYWLARLAYPLTRRLQRRFARDSLAQVGRLSRAAAPVEPPG